jgi:cellobiose PTS system EIIC component
MVLSLLCMCSAAAMYYPFLKAYERTLLKQEERTDSKEPTLAAVASR